MPVTEQLFEDTWMNLFQLRPGVWHEIRSPIKAGDRLFISCAMLRRAPLITSDAQVLKHAAQYGVSAVTPEAYVKSEIHGRMLRPPSDDELLAMISRTEMLKRRQGLPDNHPLAVAIDFAASDDDRGFECLDDDRRAYAIETAAALRAAWASKP
jgi:hypothetical protein